MSPPAINSPLDVAVVGAGLSGLACAWKVADHGHRTRVFEKARGAGGRMSTRRAESWRFDHGAQYFTVRDRGFARRVETWRRAGLVTRWQGEIAVLDGGDARPGGLDTERFVGVPGMNAICRDLAADLDVTLETRIGEIERLGDRWRLAARDGTDLGRFDVVVVSAPAAQTGDLLARASPVMAARAADAHMAPCWAAMTAFAAPLELGFDGAFVHGSPLSWVSRNGSKPGRPEGETWVLHASPDWSRRHLDLAEEEASEELLEAFRAAVGGLDEVPVHLAAHRWRYALPTKPLPEPCLFDPELRLAACGDWCGGPRVEGAFLSGWSAADRILALASGGAGQGREARSGERHDG